MANYSDRASIGGVPRPPSAHLHNAMITAAERFMQEELGGPGESDRTLRHGDAFVRNSSGSNLVRGSVLQLGDLLNTEEVDGLVYCFDGDEPDPDGSDTIAILLQDAVDDEIVEAKISGIVYCRLNLQHVQHKWADVDENDAVLQSRWHGRCEILWTEDGTVGEQDAIVRIGQMFRGPIKAVITETGGITSGGSGEVTIYRGGVAASPAATETAYLNWMTGGADGDEDAECLIEWFPDEQKYVIVALECSG